MQNVNSLRFKGIAMLLVFSMVFTLAPSMKVFADGTHITYVPSQKVTVNGVDFYYVTYDGGGDVEIDGLGTALDAKQISGTNIYYAGHQEDPSTWYYGCADIEYPDYWKNEGLSLPSSANWTKSSNKVDSEGFNDMGGFDVVSRATSKHGAYRAAYQFITDVYGYTDTDPNTKIKFVSEHDPLITDAGGHSPTTRAITSVPEVASVQDGSAGKTFTVSGIKYNFDHYEIRGIQRVPVKIAGTTYIENLILKAENKSYIDKLNDFRLGGQDGSGRVVDQNTGSMKELQSNGEYGPISEGKQTSLRNVVVEDTTKDTEERTERITTLNYNHSFGEYVTAEVGMRNDGEKTMSTVDMLNYVTRFTSATYEYFGNDSTMKNRVAKYGSMGSTDTWWSTNHGARIDAGFQFDSYRMGSTDGQTKNKQFGYWRVTFRSAGYKDLISNFYVGPEVSFEKNTLTMETGKTQSLNADIKTAANAIKSGPEYSSSNPKVVTVDQNGNVKAVGAGTATVRLDVNKGVNGDWHEYAECNITVKTPSPTNTGNEGVLGEDATPAKAAPKSFKAKAQKKKVKLSWKKSSGVTKYEIAYKLKGKKKWSYKKVAASKKSVTIKKLKSKKKYQFKIRSYKTTNNKKIYSKWSKTKTVKVK